MSAAFPFLSLDTYVFVGFTSLCHRAEFLNVTIGILYWS